jgi:FkbM family methyltransferase
MIIDPFARRFGILKNNNCHIQYVLDIGAYRGDFTQTIKYVWPSAIVRQIEADERQLPWLQDNAIIALLGDKEMDSVDFYTLSEDKVTTGSSIYKELTPHYNSATTVVIQKPMTTIDSLDAKYNFFGNWKDYGLVKIDTQGSELIILNGAKGFLEKKEPKYILLECSIKQYNAGSPLFNVVIETLANIGYFVKDVFDLSYDRSGALLQTDILFERL